MEKKYVTTEKNPTFKSGIEVKSTGAKYYITIDVINSATWFNNDSIKILLEKGYIKEVEPKEFTKSDMIVFAKYYKGNYPMLGNLNILDNWIKRKNINRLLD